MKLNQLSELMAIVEHGSLRAAARRLGLPQPALTRSIRSLERDLGATLFERDQKGMTLTAAGQLFHRRASVIVNQLEKARDELDQSHGNEHGSVSVALSMISHVQMLPRALGPFHQRYPKVRLQIIEALFPDVERRLREGTVDVYLGAAPRVAPAAGLTMEVLRENTRAVVARKGHPLRGARSLRELAGAKWASTWTDYDTAIDLRALFALHDLPEPELVLQVRTTMSVLIGLTNTDLLALLPVQWENLAPLKDMLETIPVRERLPAPAIVSVRRTDLPMTPAAEHLCDLLLRNLD